MSVLRTKSVEQSLADTHEPEHELKKDLGTWDLIVFGIGVIIGTGIFVLTGRQAALNAGPAIALSFLLAGVACALAALCYAEFASTVPVAGSAYTFSYATLGEIVAWIIGWDLALELGLGVAVVAQGWAAYAAQLFSLPESIAGGRPNWAAMFIVALLTGLAVVGTKLSGRFTGVLVVIKIAVVLFVIFAGLFYVTGANYRPFVPPARPAEGGAGASRTLLEAIFGLAPTQFGVMGIVAAASVVFFAYIGFDIVATTAEETRNPQHDVPRGILGSLAICTVLYMAVSLVIVGMVHYTELNSAAPLAEAFADRGNMLAARLISVGGITGITTVILVLLLGQARVFFAMSRDGLLPRVLSLTHPRFGTPYVITIVTGAVCTILAGFVSLNALADLVSIGTLFAFVVVSAGVWLLRINRPDLPRTFRVPALPVIASASILACLWLMVNLTVATWIRFVIWMGLGLLIYFGYGYRNSRLHTLGHYEKHDAHASGLQYQFEEPRHRPARK
jgi:APA family basic amino acid/polyamine antiporter